MLQMEKGFNRKGWTFTTFKILSKHIDFKLENELITYIIKIRTVWSLLNGYYLLLYASNRKLCLILKLKKQAFKLYYLEAPPILSYS